MVIPKKLLCLITEANKFRYWLFDGGRSSGKTQAVARWLLYLAERRPLRIVCGREIQNTIEESVHAVFKDLIQTFKLYFDVQATKIIHKKSRSEIKFRGLREQGSVNIKGLEGVDVIWIDEAQTISKQTLDVLIPTIRGENSRFYFTMNRHEPDDPVFVAMSNRKDCKHVHIDYLDNEYCPQAMKHEAEAMKVASPVDYEHIWLGRPLAKSDDYLFGVDELRNSTLLDFEVIGQQKRIMAVDVARFGGDEIVYTVLETRGLLRWEQIHLEAHKNKGIDETVGKIVDLNKQFKCESVVVDDDGVGGGAVDLLGYFNINVLPFNANKTSKNEKVFGARAEGYFKLNDWVLKGWIKLLPDTMMLEQLRQIRYKYRPNGQKAIVSKDEMRRDGLKSPDRADTLMMAVYYADIVHGQANSFGGYNNRVTSHYAVMR